MTPNGLPDAAARPPTGEVFTFYSYKGGTGRSMLLANVAWLLAAAGRRVLVMDWDLEAPGLHRYFRPFLGEDVELRHQDGIMEWLSDYWDAAVEAPEAPVERLVLEHADPRHYVRPLATEAYLSGGIDLMGAGRQDRSYAPWVADFDFSRLYQRLRGAELIRVAKEILVGPGGYDYVLVDSRTGVSDTSGLSTVALADTLVVCFTYNNQSVLGAARIARDIQQQVESQRREAVQAGLAHRFRLFAVPTRVDDLDPDRRERRQRFAWGQFADMLTDVEPARRAAYWGAVEVPNSGHFAYEETLAACMNRVTDTRSVLSSVVHLTRELTQFTLADPVDLDDAQRRELRERFSLLGADGGAAPPPDGWAQLCARVPDAGSRDALLQSCFPLLVQLFAPATAGASASPPWVRCPLSEAELTPEERRMCEALVAARVVQRRLSEDRQRVLLLADDSLVAGWDALRARLDPLGAFLADRERVRQARRSWEAGGRTIEGLRALQGEVGALEFSDEQGAWVGRPNLQFLAAMREVHAAQAREQALAEQLARQQDEARSAAQQADARREALERALQAQAETQRAQEQVQRQALEAQQARERDQAERASRRLRSVAIAGLVLMGGGAGATLWAARQAERSAEARVAALTADRDAARRQQDLAEQKVRELERQQAEKAALMHYGEGARFLEGTPQQRRYDLAIAEFGLAIAADPQFAEAYRARAVARAASGERDVAAELSDWARYYDLRPSLGSRVRLVQRALEQRPVDEALVRGQLERLSGDAAQPASRDISPEAAAARLEASLDNAPAALQAPLRAAIDALRPPAAGDAAGRPRGAEGGRKGDPKAEARTRRLVGPASQPATSTAAGPANAPAPAPVAAPVPATSPPTSPATTGTAQNPPAAAAPAPTPRALRPQVTEERTEALVKDVIIDASRTRSIRPGANPASPASAPTLTPAPRPAP